ncbi:hypothetical protein M2302_004240 [Micromonospora sp. A200]|uniref:hypothetical protein n=1 Tax=Micromonospora sp. A200 TaxID=2940568 RepID=UPI002476E298|nr:hypothetical protein [Micromonospora sp. A200]MDH6464043.1 hypothetical protein [Micromonospora sp. A200]
MRMTMLQKRRAARMHRRNWWPLAAVVLTAGAAGAAALRRRKGAGGDWVGSGGESTAPSPEVMTPAGSRMDNPLSPKR